MACLKSRTGEAKRTDHYKCSTTFVVIFPSYKFLKGDKEIIENGVVVQQTCKVKVVNRYTLLRNSDIHTKLVHL